MSYLELFGIILVAIIIILIRGFVFCVLWNWFAVPYFGLAELNIVYAFGFSVILSYLQETSVVDIEKMEKFQVRDALACLNYSVTSGATVLLLGYILKLFA
jgi:hypothetical protein